MGKIDCSVCNGYGSYSNPVLWDGIGGAEQRQCGLCNGSGKITQKTRMEYVRSFKIDKNFGQDDHNHILSRS